MVKTSPPRWLTCSLLSALFSLGSGTGFSGGTVSRSLQTFAWERREERSVINLHLGQKEPDHLGFLRASVASLAMGMMAQITQVMLGKDQLPPGPSQALTTFLLVLCFPSLANYGIVSQNSNIFFFNGSCSITVQDDLISKYSQKGRDQAIHSGGGVGRCFLLDSMLDFPITDMYMFNHENF